jgi:hypothetical protein
MKPDVAMPLVATEGFFQGDERCSWGECGIAEGEELIGVHSGTSVSSGCSQIGGIDLDVSTRRPFRGPKRALP